MANFKTHVNGAALASTSGSLLALKLHIVDWMAVPWLILAGVVGGLLPDIDSDNSKQLKWLFSLLGLLVAVMVFTTDNAIKHIHIPWLFNDFSCNLLTAFPFDSVKKIGDVRFQLSSLLFAILSYMTVRFPVLYLFKSQTVHRGAFHSLLSALLFSLITTSLSYQVIHVNAYNAWLQGCFVGFGFIVHLLLDEMYSVDLANARLKRSFGTAFKLFSYNNKFSSIGLLIATIVTYIVYCPSIQPLLTTG